ncbi:hypothetical protein AcV5_004386 [Taiwanofungus camphoratus]|nr:hypothetical protein AcV5_004386 [Antrodia cinnamomea]
MSRTWSLQEVAQHDTAKSCWVIISNKVYDVTEFLPAHPGGSKIILKCAGRDATEEYEPLHPQDAVDRYLPREKHLGELSSAAILELKDGRKSRRKTKDEIRMEEALARKPPIGRIVSLQEMEDVARSVLSFKAVSYYASAADDELTHHENGRAFSRFFFHPRVLRPISKCDPSTTILGFRSSIPVFVCGAAYAKLGHPLGEANITRGASRTGIIQMVSTNSSLSVAEIAAARSSPSQPLFFQLYKKKDDKLAEQLVHEVEGLGYNAIFLTVDAPTVGNRERDIRAPFALEEQEREVEREQENTVQQKTAGKAPRKPEDAEDDLEGQLNLGGTAGAALRNDDFDMTWEKTIPWLRSATKLPIVIKGVQCVADAVLAAEAGVDGILLSNHGGRQLEYALPPIEVLYRIRQQRPDVFNKLEVYIDGGVHRGTDVLKALCLGARAVGLGRAFLYAQSAYGEAGVVQTVRILQREMMLGMRLLGATNVSELVPEMVERVSWQPILARM